MELEETEDEEWNIRSYSSEPNANSGGKVNWVFKKGLTLGKQILMAGFVASSAPLVVPPLVVASAIGLVVSMPYAFFLASHACTQNLMSRLLPRPTPQGPPLLGDIDITHINKERPYLEYETKRDIEMADAIQHQGSKKDSSDYLCEEEEDKGLPQKHDNVKLGAEIGDGMEGHQRGESNREGTIIEFESLDKVDNEIEEFKTSFEVTTVVLEECWNQAKEGDIDEAEMQRETKGLLEKIRDEGRTDRRGEYVEGIQGVTNESDQKIGPVVENMEVALEDKVSLGTEGDMRNEEDPKLCEEMLQSRNDNNEDTICNDVESGEPVRGFLEGKEVDNANDLQRPMAESSELLDGRCFQNETIPAEPIGDLLLEVQVYNISGPEDSSEVTSEKTDMYEGKLDNNISDSVNQELQLHEYNEVMDSSDADAREITHESGLHLCEEKGIDPDVNTYTIDLHEESSNVMIDGCTDHMEVLVSSVEQESKPSECSSDNNIICPTEEVVFNEENIWKQIHVIRKIIGYEDTTKASCADELKALYIFTGVEPPTFLKENSCDPAEINEKLQFLMSIVGIK
ncbi:hypothetical protein SESBI_22817 [Sesbania bispinosa]|nr:hypothetical protein SESBI_22817 [Sesbania bispinosa]